jgi:hypothetical protein
VNRCPIRLLATVESKAFFSFLTSHFSPSVFFCIPKFSQNTDDVRLLQLAQASILVTFTFHEVCCATLVR